MINEPDFQKKELQEKLKTIEKLKQGLISGKIKANKPKVAEAIEYCINLHRFYQKRNSLSDLVEITELINELENFRLNEAILMCRQPLSYKWLEHVAKNDIFYFKDVLSWRMPTKINGLTNDFLISCVERVSKDFDKNQSRSRLLETVNNYKGDIKEELEDQFIIEKNYIKEAKERILDLVKQNNGQLSRNDYFISIDDIESIRNAIALSYLLNDEILIFSENCEEIKLKI